MSKKIPPPEGYDSWLDYALDTFDTRQIETNMAFEQIANGGGDSPTRDEIQDAAREELRELRRLAASRVANKSI